MDTRDPIQSSRSQGARQDVTVTCVDDNDHIAAYSVRRSNNHRPQRALHDPHGVRPPPSFFLALPSRYREYFVARQKTHTDEAKQSADHLSRPHTIMEPAAG